MIVPAKHDEIDGWVADIPDEVAEHVRGYSLLPDGTYRLDLAPEAEPLVRWHLATHVQRAAIARREREEAGIILTVPGMGSFEIPTGREDRAIMDGALLMLQSDTSRVIRWKAADGTRIDLSYQMLLAINTAVWGYIEDCFAHEEAVGLDPDADPRAGWPSRERVVG
jgi:hypothetical protein